jgi:hypothetical protein
VAETVMLGALNDPTYAHNLLVCRNAPQFLQHLLENPPATAKHNETGESSDAIGAGEKRNLELLKKATIALWNWGRAGFSVVDEETYQRRYGACLACEHLTDPPQRLIYKLSRRKGAHQKVCGLCGCVVEKKARLSSETCPAPHARFAELNRWGEPFG